MLFQYHLIPILPNSELYIMRWPNSYFSSIQPQHNCCINANKLIRVIKADNEQCFVLQGRNFHNLIVFFRDPFIVSIVRIRCCTRLSAVFTALIVTVNLVDNTCGNVN